VLDNDPRRQNVALRASLVAKWSFPIISVLVQVMLLFTALGKGPDIGLIACLVVGITIMIIGNYLPKCRQNYTYGIKLPWTLDNEENWNKTHHLAGFIWTASGIAVIAAAFFSIRYIVVFAASIVSVMFPIVYSFLLYHHQTQLPGDENDDDSTAMR
jgi:uncharacterized membrane protein